MRKTRWKAIAFTTLLATITIALIGMTAQTALGNPAENATIGSEVPYTTIEAVVANNNGTFEGATLVVAGEETLLVNNENMALNANDMANPSMTTAQETTGNTAANTVMKTATDASANLVLNIAKATTAGMETTGNTAANTVMKTPTMAVFAINFPQNKAGAHENIAA